jgi:hypothetical protein
MTVRLNTATVASPALDIDACSPFATGLSA